MTNTSIIKLLTEDYCVQAAVFPSDANEDVSHERQHELI